MEIINIVEFVGDQLAQIRSYPITSDKTKEEVIETAESDFIKLIKANGYDEDDELSLEYFLDEGSYERNDYKIFLSWSE